MIKECSAEEFFEAPFRGVTSVLNAVFGNKFENSSIPEHILQAAGERGTACHNYIEIWEHWFMQKDDSIPEPHLGLLYSVYETNFKEFLKDRIELIDVLATEQKMLSPQIFMKGILDAVWTVKDRTSGKQYTCLIDFKTSSHLDTHTANMQMQLYYYMLSHGNKEERELASKITELRVLSLTKKDYSWYKFEINTKLAESIIYLWNIYYINEAFKTKKIINPEKWKDIKGYEGRYEISNFGRVKSHVNLRTPVYYMMPELSKSGYYKINLTNTDGKRKCFNVHDLVAEAFIGKENKKIKHKDGDSLNNYYENLEYK